MYEMGRLVYEMQKINCLNRTNKIAIYARKHKWRFVVM